MGKESYISRKKLHEFRVGEVDELSVSLLFDHNGEKMIEKSFSFEKTDEDTIKIGKLKFCGYDITCGEHNFVDGKILINQCYDWPTQNFTMFKGEYSLNVFKESMALLVLSVKYADHESYDKLASYAEGFAMRAKVAYEHGFMKDETISDLVRKIEDQIDQIQTELQQVKCQIRIDQDTISSLNDILKNLEDFKHFSVAYNDIKDVIASKKAMLYSYASRLYEPSCADDKIREYLSDIVNKLDAGLREFEEKESCSLLQEGNPDERWLKDVCQSIVCLMIEREKVQKKFNEQVSIASYLENKIKGLNSELDKLVQSVPVLKSLRQASIALSKIFDAFKQAKEKHLSKILSELQSSANDYMERLGVEDESDKIRLILKPSSSVEVKLYSIKEEVEKEPSYSQMVLMYVAIMFAISDLIESYNKTKYPLILDLNFVSTNDKKRNNIYKVISKLNKQCIVICNDFLSPICKVNMDVISSFSCSAYTLVKNIELIKGIPSYITTTCYKLK